MPAFRPYLLISGVSGMDNEYAKTKEHFQAHDLIDR